MHLEPLAVDAVSLVSSVKMYSIFTGQSTFWPVVTCSRVKKPDISATSEAAPAAARHVNSFDSLSESRGPNGRVSCVTPWSKPASEARFETTIASELLKGSL